jgi:hypothetical protein
MVEVRTQTRYSIPLSIGCASTRRAQGPSQQDITLEKQTQLYAPVQEGSEYLRLTPQTAKITLINAVHAHYNLNIMLYSS